MIARILGPILAILLAPLLQGLINRTKALMAGRCGAPLAQPYFDLLRLIRKGAVISPTTTRIFGLAPAAGLALTLVAALMLPFGNQPAALSFAGDFILLCYLLGCARFLTVLAALDTGSSFEGLGASREMLLGALAEPAIFLALGAAAYQSSSLSLSGMNRHLIAGLSPAMLLSLSAIAMVLLAENSRLPVDDPTTHLELTMIHEVMVLDHSGPDFAFILYGQGVKLWALGAVLTGLIIPARGDALLDPALGALGIFGLAVAIGIGESSMARLRLLLVPRLLVGATALSGLALILLLR